LYQHIPDCRADPTSPFNPEEKRAETAMTKVFDLIQDWSATWREMTRLYLKAVSNHSIRSSGFLQVPMAEDAGSLGSHFAQFTSRMKMDEKSRLDAATAAALQATQESVAAQMDSAASIVEAVPDTTESLVDQACPAASGVPLATVATGEQDNESEEHDFLPENDPTLEGEDSFDLTLEPASADVEDNSAPTTPKRPAPVGTGLSEFGTERVNKKRIADHLSAVKIIEQDCFEALDHERTSGLHESGWDAMLERLGADSSHFQGGPIAIIADPPWNAFKSDWTDAITILRLKNLISALHKILAPGGTLMMAMTWEQFVEVVSDVHIRNILGFESIPFVVTYSHSHCGFNGSLAKNDSFSVRRYVTVVGLISARASPLRPAAQTVP
jgi:hypothetical protein